LGDSLTLGRQTFSESMAEWIERTVKAFADREDVQLVIRVHPGELLIHGTSMVDVVQNALGGEIPPQIHLVGPEEKVNTYDITDITDLGLVYTTTVGLEMALRGIPVVVAGQTHYRNRGFTQDPNTWEAYFETLDKLLADLKAARLTQEQVELAWRYAYLFFFVFPKPFPWHLLNFKADLEERPVAFVLGEEGTRRYGETFAFLTGKPLTW
jgi:capsule polysaccharide export protein KpsC/LpsZ